jgi:hypothetical protein
MALGWARWLVSIITASQESEMGRITVQGQPRKKVSKTPFQSTESWMGWYVPVISAMWETRLDQE